MMNRFAGGAKSRFKAQHAWIIIFAAWFLFLVSLLLPAIGRTRGWEVALGSMVLLFNFFGWFVMLFNPSMLILLACPFFNFAMILGPWLASRDPENASRISAFLCPAVLVPLMLLPSGIIDDPAIGFYIWLGSFFLMAVGCWWLEKSYAEWTE